MSYVSSTICHEYSARGSSIDTFRNESCNILFSFSGLHIQHHQFISHSSVHASCTMVHLSAASHLYHQQNGADLGVLHDLALISKNSEGQSYDSFANTSGLFSGMQALIQKKDSSGRLRLRSVMRAFAQPGWQSAVDCCSEAVSLHVFCFLQHLKRLGATHKSPGSSTVKWLSDTSRITTLEYDGADLV